MARGRTPATEKPKRIRLAFALLSQGWMASEIIDILMKQYSIAEGCAGAYIIDARAIMRANANMEEVDVKAQSFAFYSKLSRNTKANVSERLAARRQIDRIYGIIKPAPNSGFLNMGKMVVAAPNQLGATLEADDSFEAKKERKVQELMGQYVQHQIVQAKTFDLALPDDVKDLAEKIDTAKNITPSVKKKVKGKK